MDAPIAGLLLICLLAAPVSCLGQDTQDSTDLSLSREEWHQRVDEARRRSEAFVANARSRAPAPLSSSELENESTERALRDPSLREGDMVVTGKGLLIFVGKDEKHEPSDFISAPNTK